MFSDTETSHNFQHGLHRHIESKAPRWEGETQVDDDAFLRMREVYLQMKKKEQEDQQKMRELAAQLARTEEAAKRLMVRTDKSARGGAAARLLAAEKELSRITADATETRSKLRDFARSNRDLKGKNTELKGKLEEAMRDQRRLIVEVGKAQRQSSRLGLMRSSHLQRVSPSGAQIEDSSVQLHSPQQPSSPGSTAAQSPQARPYHRALHPLPDVSDKSHEAIGGHSGQRSARALHKLKMLCLSRCESPRIPAAHHSSGGSGTEALQSLEHQVREALHRAADLQQQLSTIQALSLVPDSKAQPAPHSGDSDARSENKQKHQQQINVGQEHPKEPWASPQQDQRPRPGTKAEAHLQQQQEQQDNIDMQDNAVPSRCPQEHSSSKSVAIAHHLQQQLAAIQAQWQAHFNSLQQAPLSSFEQTQSAAAQQAPLCASQLASKGTSSVAVHAGQCHDTDTKRPTTAVPPFRHEDQHGSSKPVEEAAESASQGHSSNRHMQHDDDNSHGRNGRRQHQTASLNTFSRGMQTEEAGDSHARESGDKLTGSAIGHDNHTDKSLMRQQLQVMHGHARPEAGGRILRRINPGIEGWPDPDRFLTIALHSVRLDPKHAQRLMHQRLFLMYSFLPTLCPAEEQCTHSLPATETLLTFQHVQAYDICGEHKLGDSADKSTQSCTGPGNELTIPICLVRQSQDLAREQHQQIALCRLNLMEGDRLHDCTVLYDKDGSAAARLTVSITGSACMAS